MTISVTKKALNVREKLAELDKPTGIAGEAMLRAETPQEQFNLIGAGRRNWIINGSHIVNQRNVLPFTGMTNGQYQATDRWKSYIYVGAANASLSNSRLKATASNSNLGIVGFTQTIEDYSVFAGKTVTVSAVVKSNNRQARLRVYDGTTSYYSNAHSGSGLDETLTLTVTLSPSTSVLVLYIAIITNTAGYVDITSGDYIEFTEVQLELGKVATPFEHRSYGEELALCQRYYYRIDGRSGYSILPTFGAYSANNAAGSIPFPVELRARPTALEQSGTAGDYFLTDSSGAGQACTSVPTFGGSTHKKGASVVMTSTGNVSAGNASIPTMGANGYLAWSAEL